jgi:signal transduction histidine kinase
LARSDPRIDREFLTFLAEGCGERSRTTPGNGLGLSLVNAVAEIHGAELSLVATRPGLRVRLAFPVAKRPPPDT